MDLTNGIKKAFLASVGAVATTAEVTKDIVEKMIEKGEQTVEQGKVLNQELKHNAKKKVKEHVSVEVTKNTMMRLNALMRCQQKILSC